MICRMHATLFVDAWADGCAGYVRARFTGHSFAPPPKAVDAPEYQWPEVMSSPMHDGAFAAPGMAAAARGGAAMPDDLHYVGSFEDCDIVDMDVSIALDDDLVAELVDDT
jgi:hypothetical protein